MSPADSERRPPFAPPRPRSSVILIHRRPRASIEGMFTFSSSLFSLIRFTRSALPCLSRRRAAPRQVMLSMSYQAKRRRSCRLMSGFTSSELAPSSCCRVSKYQSAKPPSAFALHVDSSPPATIRCPSTSVSSAPAPRCSPTQSPGASIPRPSQHHRFPICSFFRRHLIVDSHLRSFPGPASAAKTSASTSRTSLTTSLAPATNGLTPHQRCPPPDRRRRCKSYPDELATPLAPQINSLRRPPAPPHRWASPDLASAAAGRSGERAPYFLWWAASASRGRPLTEAG
jgi:hypothetical protein